MTPINTALKTAYRSVITFEGNGDPICVRETVSESSPDEAARKAVFRALPEVSRRTWNSLVIVLDKVEGE